MQGLTTFFPSIMDVPDKPATLISAAAAFVTSFAPGDTSWQAPYTGFWSFVLRGGGAYGSPSQGGSGAASKRTVYLVAGQIVNFTIGFGGASGLPAQDTVVTFPDGIVVTAGKGNTGSPGTGGTASGGDVNINGNDGDGSHGGSAPAIDTFPAVPYTDTARAPGPGSGGFFGSLGGNGILYIYSVGS